MASKNGESLLQKLITRDDVAALTVQSDRNVSRLMKLGVLRQASGKRRGYVLGEVIPAFVEHLRDEIARADPNTAAYVKARAARMNASAEMTQIELRHKRGELLERERVEFTVGGFTLCDKKSSALARVSNNATAAAARC